MDQISLTARATQDSCDAAACDATAARRKAHRETVSLGWDHGRMGANLSKKNQQDSRTNGIRDGLCQAVTQGIGEHYFSAFALLLRATPLQIGWLSALPQLVGTWAQIFATSQAVSQMPRKKLLLFGSLGQAMAWLPLFVLPLLFTDHAPVLFIACAVIYTAFGHMAVPAWNSLITDIVSPNLRGQYFGRRAQLMAVGNFAALTTGGLLLHLSERWSAAWSGFALVFLLAAAARMMSAFFLGRMTDLAPPRPTIQPAGFIDLLAHRSSRDFKRFLCFSGLMHAATLLAGPYFVIYLLHDLHLSYAEYGTWLAAQMVGQFISLKSWGRLGDRCGHAAVLTVTGYLVPLLPMLYLLNSQVPYLVCVNLLAGMVWSGFSLGLQNYVFDAVPAADKGRAVALANTINAIGWCTGALAGGWLAAWLPAHLSGFGVDWSLDSNLLLLFLLSGCLRLAVSALFLPRLRELRTDGRCSARRLLSHLPVLQPLHRVLLRSRRKPSPSARTSLE